MLKRTIVIFAVLFGMLFQPMPAAAGAAKHPDYSIMFVGEDKWENFNRRMFNFNLKLNKYAIRPLHILWASVMPEYGMDRIYCVTKNIEYPIRLVSSLIQKDFTSAKNETIRFFTNSTIGLGGLFDPAKRFFKIESSQEDMEQALAGCKMESGPYLVLPVISSTCPRGILGSLLDIALNPGSYIATPVLAAVKAGLFINKTSLMQPLISMVEANYADPYDIARKAYGIERYIKRTNMDKIRLSELTASAQNEKDKTIIQKSAPLPTVRTSVTSEIVVPELYKGGAIIEDFSAENYTPAADIILNGYNPQNPIVDSMRTALLNNPETDKSIWNEISIWNRSFSHRFHTGYARITKGRADYKYRYILNKDKNSPVAVIYPSIGEGINSSHSVIWAKLFYDAGYSVVIQGSHFGWEFVKSMPKGYHPGLPAVDAEQLRRLTALILFDLNKKYGYSFDKKVIFGTSFGAVAALFVGDKESQHNTLGKVKYIAVCPPVELLYAMAQIDKNSKGFDGESKEFQDRAAMTAAKILKLYNSMDENNGNLNISALPFSEEEGKIITSFIMHQKLSDLIYAIEDTKENSSKHDIYNQINNTDYKDYARKYLLSSSDKNTDDLSYETSLHSISDFLEHNNNYKIYHSVNDYLTNSAQLRRLKDYAGSNVVLLDNGAHLGFTYREEFLSDLKKTIASLYN